MTELRILFAIDDTGELCSPVASEKGKQYFCAVLANLFPLELRGTAQAKPQKEQGPLISQQLLYFIRTFFVLEECKPC